ncbi:hypothetical protein [Helicobacter turcicus]|uniref:Uncharacterized protein n=1 Tax=Helicobacter turcicus TaxID=2867412 RepID=A0ABS7JNQ0_9HELI|nr:hypothetical protein [Helicobacter turcicus]MBX7491035.1 hypothetical protein [Helicobacter turcicus]MBX7546296.1 hypothetical protein [Helicobacter turcicus]
MHINNQANIYSDYRNSSVLLNRSANSTIKNKEQKVELSDAELLKQVREYNNYPVLYSFYDNYGLRQPCLVSQTFVMTIYASSTHILIQEIETKAAELSKTATPTKYKYEQSLRFLEQQMDKIMAEIARENYDVIQLAKRILKVEFAAGQAPIYSQEEEDFISSRCTVNYASLLYIMGAYHFREFRESTSYETLTRTSRSPSS